MTKIDIFSGFLGAGKTTLIKKLLKEALAGQRIVLIENEFGEIGIDGGFLKDAGIEITEMNSGCICCSLVGDFGEALKKVLEQYAPERILIEPSGVGKLSDVIRAVADVVEENDDVEMGAFVTVVDTLKCRMYMKNFGEFFNNQIEHATTIILSRSQKATQEQIANVTGLLREHNEKATIVTTAWDEIDGAVILKAMEPEVSMAEEMMHQLQEERKHHHHHEHHHDHDEECSCGEHHHHHHEEECDDPECECHHHEHHHDHDEACGCGEHHHHHHHEGECDDPECECHHEHHHHDGACGCGHHHHHADEVFTSWGVESPKKFSQEQLNNILEALSGVEQTYGIVLRAKGIVPSVEAGTWLHFDMTPGEAEVRVGAADYTGRICVIGSGLDEAALKELFGV